MTYTIAELEQMKARLVRVKDSAGADIMYMNRVHAVVYEDAPRAYDALTDVMDLPRKSVTPYVDDWEEGWTHGYNCALGDVLREINPRLRGNTGE